MYCRTCGNEMNDNAELCVKCGVRRNVGNDYCQICGSKTDANMTSCPNCHAVLKSAKSTMQIKKEVSAKSKNLVSKALIIVGYLAMIICIVVNLVGVFGGGEGSPLALAVIGAVLVVIGKAIQKKP